MAEEAAGPGAIVEEEGNDSGSPAGDTALPGIRRVGVVGEHRYADLSGVVARIEEVAEARGLELHYEESIREIGSAEAEPLDLDAEPVDLLLTLGGDGTLLRGARLVAGMNVPVVGINLGHLGFLAAASEDEVGAALERLVEGNFTLDPRFTLDATILHADGTHGETMTALNDVVVHNAGVARVVRLDLVVKQGSVTDEIGSFAGDGVILATPTGSTAYSLAAGGPIIVPTVDCMVVTPISPHTLAFRPLVIPATDRVTVRSLEPTEELVLTVDGKFSRSLADGDSVMVSRGDVQIPLVRFAGQSFFATLRRKLNWAVRTGEQRSGDG